MSRKVKICEHGLTDQVEITDKTVIEDYRHRTRSIVYGFWCVEHQLFGSCMMKEKNVEFPPRETTAPRAANA